MNKYKEEEPGYTPITVMEEASRCLLCYDAPCSKSCPAKTDPGRFIRAIRFRNVKGAAEVIRENNPLGGVCARVCPTERYCQYACSRTGIDRPIDIGKIQRYATDQEALLGMDILVAGPDKKKSVGIIGSGPSGLSAASWLRRVGYRVTIYEKDALLGGVMRYGIPEYRLPQAVLDQEIGHILKLGVTVKANCQVGKDIAFADLRKKHDAVLVCTGSSYGKTLDSFKGYGNVAIAVDFLKELKEKFGEVRLPNNVLVIGGGDVAMDVCTSLRRLGVDQVTDVVYERFKEFRASKKELEGAQSQGVSIIDGYVPVSFDGKTAVFKGRALESELRIKADLVILAVGQLADPFDSGLSIVKNEVETDLDSNYATAIKGVYFSGDLATGDKTVVYGVRKGHEAAAEIAKYLEQEGR